MQYIYIIKSENYYKIGTTRDVEARMKLLQTGNPHKLEVIKIFQFGDNYSAFQIEQLAHKVFGHKRFYGEWFVLDESDVEKLEVLLPRWGESIPSVENARMDAIDLLFDAHCIAPVSVL